MELIGALSHDITIQQLVEELHTYETKHADKCRILLRRFILRAHSLRGDMTDRKRAWLRMKTSEELVKRLSSLMEHKPINNLRKSKSLNSVLYTSTNDDVTTNVTESFFGESNISCSDARSQHKITSQHNFLKNKRCLIHYNSNRNINIQSCSSYGSEECLSAASASTVVCECSSSATLDLLNTAYVTEDMEKYCDDVFIKDKPELKEDLQGLSQISVADTSTTSPAESEIEKSDTDWVIHTLLKQVSVQKSVMTQCTKALTLCKGNGKNEEIVQAEKSLLIATQKHQALLAEIHRLQFQGTWKDKQCSEHGTVIMKDITFPLKKTFLKISEKELVKYEYWFICLATYRHMVVATKPICYNGSENLIFTEPLIVENLKDDFKLLLDIYLMRLKKKQPGKLDFFLMQKKLPWFRPNDTQLQNVQMSQFYLIGSLSLHRHDLTSLCWILSKNFPSSPLQGYVDMFVETYLKMNLEYTGFLSVLTESRSLLVWHRQWCQLTEYYIKYWNYPSHQDDQAPVGIVDLRKCVSDCIKEAPRELCARPHTLMLETARPFCEDDDNTFLVSCKATHAVIRHFFSADTRDEFSTWCDRLNHVVNVLRTWHVV